MRLPVAYFACLVAATAFAQPQSDATSVEVDKTFVPGISRRMRGGPGTSDSGRFAPGADIEIGSGLPTLITPLEQQPDLRLVKVKDVPVNVLVIGHAEKVPTEN